MSQPMFTVRVAFGVGILRNAHLSSQSGWANVLDLGLALAHVSTDVCINQYSLPNDDSLDLS